MGGMFLFRKTAAIDLDAVESVFQRKGLSRAQQFELGHWGLTLYPKIAVEDPNYYSNEKGLSVFCCGTVVYRGLGYRDSLRRLLYDFEKEYLDPEELIGNFALLFWDGRHLSLVTDRLNAQHLFSDKERSCVSSSFLAILAANPRKNDINQLGVLEKLATGVVMGPDTLVKPIDQLDDELLADLKHTAGITWIPHAPVESLELHNQGLQDSVEHQIEVLREYFRRLANINCEYGIELGLSDGFDSRLLLALSEVFGEPIPLHSHHTVGVHEKELEVSRELASIGGHQQTVVATRHADELKEEERATIIDECLYFFDGRCIHDMGSYSETYTARYRCQVIGDRRVSLHGLGGEIYRNAYQIAQGRINTNEWLDLTVFFPFAREACGSNEAFREMREHLKIKIGKRLGVDITKTIDFHTTRRYYGLVRMPDGASNVSNAYNQVGFLFTPFIEAMTLREALRATPYIGCGGAYEAAMIRVLSPALAAVPSQYGHSFAEIPLRFRLKSRICSMLPIRLRLARLRRLLSSPGTNPNAARARRVRAASPSLQGIEDVLHSIVPGSNWDFAMLADTQRVASISVGSFLREFHHKLRL